MEEQETKQDDNLYITFTIGRPTNERESEFASLVFRLLKINDFMKNDRIFDFDIKANNKNVLEMQQLLEDFIVKEEL